MAAVDMVAAPAARAIEISFNQPAEPRRFVTPAQRRHAAKALHQRGELRAAEHLYRAVLNVDASDFDCLHNLGLLCVQEGRLDDALDLLRAGARQDPRSVEAHNNLANVLAALQRHDEAAAGFRAAIALKPDFAEAHNNLGNAMAAQGKTDEALRHYRQALALRGAYGDAHLNLARILVERGELDAAEKHLQQALALGTRPAETHFRLGELERKLGKSSAAAASYRRALALTPSFVEAHCRLGAVLLEGRDFPAAKIAFEQALALKADLAEAWLGVGHLHHLAGRYEQALTAFARAPALAEAWIGRARALRRLKKPEEAVFAYRQALVRGADAEIIRYYLAALGAEPTPPAAPRQLVRTLFDRYSDRYDRHVIERLSYQTPALLFDALARFLPARKLDIVDLGCGTGLAGALFRPLAGKLSGVDISASMLGLARRRQIYDELVCGEATEFLRAQTERFDLALAADVFVYLGDLSELFGAVHRALKPGGCLAFSVEAAEAQDFALRPTLRYAHSASYLRKLAADRGFALEALETKVLRREDESDVKGHLAIVRRC